MLSADPLDQVVDEAAEYWEWNRWTVAPDGHLFRAPDREKWLIERYDLDGNLTRPSSGHSGPRPRTEEEFEDMKGNRSFVFNGQKAKITYKLLDTEGPIGDLSVVGDRLWVYP